MYRRVHFFLQHTKIEWLEFLATFLFNKPWLTYKFSFYPYSSILVITFKELGNVLPFFDKVFIISVFSWTSGFSNFSFLYKIPHPFSPTLERTHVFLFPWHYVSQDFSYFLQFTVSCNLVLYKKGWVYKYFSGY